MGKLTWHLWWLRHHLGVVWIHSQRANVNSRLLAYDGQVLVIRQNASPNPNPSIAVVVVRAEESFPNDLVHLSDSPCASSCLDFGGEV